MADSQEQSRGSATNMDLFGRRVIMTPYSDMNEQTVLKVLSESGMCINSNQAQVRYLQKYYDGYQPILARVKTEGRTSICNKVVENWASDIVSFKVGYLLGEPVQYVARSGDDKAEAINELNDQMAKNNKQAQDLELADDFAIDGTSYRLILPNEEWNRNNPEEPQFKIYACDPDRTFVIYNSGVGHRPVMGGIATLTVDGDLLYSIYTDKEYFEILNGTKVIKREKHQLGDVPIIEYPNNKHRLGEFEIVLPMLDAINTLTSNRLDAIEGFVQALFLLKGVNIESEDFKRLLDLGAMSIPADADAKYLVQELNQEQTETLKKDMLDTVFQICGIPNRHTGASASDNGVAVIYRDGWSDAEARAKRTELVFASSERRMLKIALRIMNTLTGFELSLSDIDIRFTRRNYENTQGKAQVLIQLLSNPKIHPKLAFERSGLFRDANLAYSESMEYYEEQLKKDAKRIIDGAKNDDSGSIDDTE